MSGPRVWRCDRCGFEMIERHCKVVCPNCGARWDCSDVTIWVGDARQAYSTRRYRTTDYAALARRWAHAPSAVDLQEGADGAWLLLEGNELRGYAALFPVPGLPQMRHLQADVQQSACADGAAQLLGALLENVDSSEVSQITVEVESLQSDAARFFQTHGFTLEHVEWRMRGPLPPQQARQHLPEGYTLRTLPMEQAISHFLRLYDMSFSPAPWYQPYSRAEVASELHDPGDILFAIYGEQPVGFAWLQQQGDSGEVEPIGIAPEHQGRGVGAALFNEALWRLSERGLKRAVVGVWGQNRAAISLYERAGLQRVRQRTYLSLEIP